MGDRLHWNIDGPRWPFHEASRFVEAGGCRWHVQVLDSAPPGAPALWLLHGTGAATPSWRGLVPWLAPHFTLVLPDLPGHGFSGRLPPGHLSLPGMAAALADLVQAIDLPPAAIVGHSAGAALALRAVLDGRLSPRLVVGLNAALLPFGGWAHRVFAPMARLMSRQPLVPWMIARGARDAIAVRRLVASTGSKLDAEGLAFYTRLLRSPPHVAGALMMMAHWDLAGLWRDLPRLQVPTLLVVGSRDQTVPPPQAQQARLHMPGTRLLTLDGLGHLAHEESPQRVAELLLPRLLPLGAAGPALPQTPPRAASQPA
jgi:magnesium chelatase accessory protein